eukprot:TRINITY_DN9800_c0_g1_i1.p1 TRINITY_DN9800_c0_g1~~TRINITY_DN9800_c0_g1_i1.p1  ORF type:complete len:1719 (+),score=283.19 TRINITY_DN9800_c0_g1_i1:81-5237(+)
MESGKRKKGDSRRSYNLKDKRFESSPVTSPDFNDRHRNSRDPRAEKDHSNIHGISSIQHASSTSTNVLVMGVFYLTHERAIINHEENIVKKRSLSNFAHSVLANSNVSAYDEPFSLTSLPSKPIAIASGTNMIALLTGSGDLFLTGPKMTHYACLGQLESIPHQDEFKFYRVPISNVRLVKPAAFHTAALTWDNKVYVWGFNMNEFKLGSTNPRSKSSSQLISGQLGTDKVKISPPIELVGFEGQVRDIACGGAHTVVVTDKATYTCGITESGVLGRATADFSKSLPVPLLSSFVIQQVACGYMHTIALSDVGNVFVWGSNLHGQLGLGPNVQNCPQPHGLSDPSEISQISCGSYHNAILTNNNQIFVWGANEYGELGVGLSKKVQHTPLLVRPFQDKTSGVSAGANRSVVLAQDGRVFIAGRLAAPAGAGHQFTFREVEFSQEEQTVGSGSNQRVRVPRVISQAACGLTHFVFLEDSLQTSALTELLRACSNVTNLRSMAYLKGMLMGIPQESIKILQMRAMRILYEKSKGQLPLIEVDTGYLKFQREHGISTSEPNWQGMTVKNLCGERIRVSVISNTQLYQDYENQGKLTYSLRITPSKFYLEKDQSMGVRVILNEMFDRSKEINDRITSVFSIIVDNSKYAKNLWIFRYFILCDIYPSPQENVNEKNRDPQMTMTLLKTLASYVPRTIHRKYRTVFDPPTSPTMDTFLSSILFIDISGFTLLSERLGKLGPAGPELVSKHLNIYFGQLIEAVNNHGGDVLKFAGDALICMFGDSSLAESLEDLTMKAIQCGVHIQTRLATYDSGEGFSLTLHVGIGAGEIHAVHVGGDQGCWEFLVIGDPLLQLKTAVDNSKSGEVVISNEAFGVVDKRIEAEARGNDWCVKKISAPVEIPRIEDEKTDEFSIEMEEALRCYIPLGVQHRIDSFQMSWLAELRNVTVLFVKLSSLVYEKGRLPDLVMINRVLFTMQAVIFRSEGMVRQFLVDDKGTVLIAAFGVPPFSHEDDVYRGTQAALEIQEELAKFELTNYIGITTGKVFCGSVGSPQRQEYAMVGDIVNLSARLMGVAEKLGVPLLCDETTFLATRFQFAFDRHNPVMVKGKLDPVQIYVPRAKKDQAISEQTILRGAEMIGRNREKLTIQNQIMDLAQGGHGSILLIEGNPGLGKTSLVSFAKLTCKLNQLGHYLAKCGSLEKTTPFFVWSLILKQLLDFKTWQTGKSPQIRPFISPSLTGNTNTPCTTPNSSTTHTNTTTTTTNLSPTHNNTNNNSHNNISINQINNNNINEEETNNAELEFLVGDSWREYLPLLNNLLPELQIPENQLMQTLSVARTLMYTRELIKYLISLRVAASPCAIILEDLQWMDPHSLALTAEIARDVHPLLLLVTSRPHAEPVNAEYKALSAMATAEKIKLGPLSEQECQALVCKLLKVNSLPDELLSTVEKANGNPLFAMQLALELRESGCVEIVDGTCRIANSPHTGLSALPNTIEGIITFRIDQLSASHQLVLKIASAIGIRFSLETMEGVFPIDETRSQLEVILKELIKLDFIAKKSVPLSRKSELRPPPSNQYVFNNAIIREVAYSRMLFQQRQDLHVRIAEFYEQRAEVFTDQVSKMTQIAEQWYQALQSNTSAPSDQTRKAFDYLKAAGDRASSVSTEEAFTHYNKGLKILLAFPNHFSEKSLRELRLKIAALPVKPSSAQNAFPVTTPRSAFVSRGRNETVY